MPKKPIFTKKHIYKTAFDLFKKEGLKAVTARNLAKKLNSSPAPIYSFYSTIDDLKEELLDDAKKLFLKYLKGEYTDKEFLNIGMGICIFARNEKELFKTIFLRQVTQKRNEVLREFRDLIRKEMDRDSRFACLDQEARMEVYLDAWTYAHGLSTLIATNYFDEITDEEIKTRLMKGAAVIIYSRINK